MDMMGDWDHVASDVSRLPDPNVILIGHVDCSKKDVGDPLCKQLGITTLPTLLYFDPPLAPAEVNGTAYTGNHSYTMLRRFARSLMCNADFPDQYCSKKQRALLPQYLAMGEEERRSKLAQLQQTVADADRDHKALADALQEQYLASERRLAEMRADMAKMEDTFKELQTWWISKQTARISKALGKKLGTADRGVTKIVSAVVSVIAPSLPVWMGGTGGSPADKPAPPASPQTCAAQGHTQ